LLLNVTKIENHFFAVTKICSLEAVSLKCTLLDAATPLNYRNSAESISMLKIVLTLLLMFLAKKTRMFVPSKNLKASLIFLCKVKNTLPCG
jgi:hypothetical protein